MSTLYDAVYVKCPYFLRGNKKRITCEGIAEGCEISLDFDNENDKKLHKQVFCDEKYQNCEVCRMLEKKYEE